MGDLTENALQDDEDVEAYLSGVVGDDLSPTSCADLNTDGRISVSDAALLSSCLYFSAGHPHSGGDLHDHCNLPQSLLNIFDTVSFRLGAINFDEGWVDIEVRNPYNDLIAYQLQLSGLDILSVESLTDDLGYAHRPEYALGGQRIVGINRRDSALTRSSVWVPLVRVHWFALTAAEICLASVEDAVNQAYESTLHTVEGECRPVTAAGVVPQDFNPLNVQAFPNPASESLTLRFPNPDHSHWTLELFHSNGQLALVQEAKGGDAFHLDVSALPAGLYRYRLQGEAWYSGSFVVAHHR
jgi:hypothetical protein